MKSVIAITLIGLLAACSVGPDYERPVAPNAPAYKEQAGWKMSEPSDDADRGDWWLVFNDPVLNRLEEQVSITNYNLKASEAAYRAALGALGTAKAGFWPTVGLNGNVRRTGGGTSTIGIGSGGSSGGSTGAPAGGTATVVSGNRTTYSTNLSATWELDVWGRIRRTVEQNNALVQATAGDIASARLSAQATLATSYFQLRVADEQMRLYARATEAYEKSLKIANAQFTAGTNTKADVAQAEAQLQSARSQALAVQVTRSQLEHAIAVLMGVPPADLTIEPVELMTDLPEIPLVVQAKLLERRPDIAAAERRVAAANAAVGVATAAWFPTLSLGGSYGFQSTSLGELFSTGHNFWSVGPALAQTVLDFGRRSGQVDQARAQWEQTVAQYRQTALTALQQVEDQLVAIRLYGEQAQVQELAVNAARDAERIQTNRYKAGTASYTDVITAQQTALSNEQTRLAVVQNQWVGAVTLIQALGGGWDARELEDAPRHDLTMPERESDSSPAKDGEKHAAK